MQSRVSACESPCNSECRCPQLLHRRVASDNSVKEFDITLFTILFSDWNKTEINHAPDEKESVFIFTMLLQALTPPAIASIGIGVVAVATVAAFDNITATSVMFTTNVFRAVVKVQVQ